MPIQPHILHFREYFDIWNKEATEMEKTTEKKVIRDIMANTTGSFIISLWRSFKANLNTESKGLFLFIKRINTNYVIQTFQLQHEWGIIS